MGQREGIDRSKACPRTPLRPRMIGRITNTNHREIIVAAGLIAVLSISALSIYPFMVPASNERHSYKSTYAVIAIDGDANFSDTALLEGWPGDGSPENPFIIDGLNIECGDAAGHGISIINTRASFTLGNCNLTGFYSTCGHSGMHPDAAGIYLENVTNGELVNNTCSSNGGGIELWDSYSNSLVNNTCNNNRRIGIYLEWSNSNTMVNNICSNNDADGIWLVESHSNTVADNTCSGNGGGRGWCGSGIYLGVSHYNTVANNICSNNTDFGISFFGSSSNTITGNTLNGCGFFFTGALTDCRQLEVTGNSVNTLPLVFLQDQVGNVVSSPAGQVILVNCSQVTVKDQTLMNCSVGILLCHTDLTILVNNTCTSNRIECYYADEYRFHWASGIRLDDSHYNTVTNNTCNNNRIGIWLGGSDSNTVTNNTCINNTIGIALDSSTSNTLANNTCSNNRIGIALENSDSNTVADNTCNSNRREQIGWGSGISLEESYSNTVANNICNHNQGVGISLDDSHYNNVVNNICNYNGGGGIRLHDATSNVVTDNICLATPDMTH